MYTQGLEICQRQPKERERSNECLKQVNEVDSRNDKSFIDQGYGKPIKLTSSHTYLNSRGSNDHSNSLVNQRSLYKLA